MMIHQLRLLLGVAMLFQAGCTAFAPPKQAHLTAPKKMRSGVVMVTSQEDLSQKKWWLNLHDPMLTQLINEALCKNNQIQTARANILQAEAKLKEARFAWMPTLSANANGFIGGGWDSSVSAPGLAALSPTLTKLGNIHFKGYYSGFMPSYSLNLLQNIHNNKFAEASLALQQATYQSTRLSIISQISGSYFMLLGQREQLREQQALIDHLKMSRQLEWSRYQAGATDLSTVIALDQQLATNAATSHSLENSIAQLENAIRVLLNRNPGPLTTHRTINSLSVQGMVPANLSSAVLKNRPDVMMAKQNLNMTESNIGLAYSNFFPTISLTGLLGQASLDLAHLLNVSTGLWVAEAAASMPLLNGSSYEKIKEAKASYRAAYYSYVQTVRSAFSDVDNSLTNFEKMNEMYQDKLRARKASQQAYALAKSRYNAGSKDYREVLNAQLSVDNAKLDLNLAKMQQLDSLVGVYQAVAGGYH